MKTLPNFIATDKLRDRFWRKVDKSGGENACWVWMAAKNDAGYGLIRVAGKNYKAHRVAWVLQNGPIDDGVGVLHKCDNPPCVNFRHLFNGSQGDNMKDMVSKNRHLSRIHALPRGDNHWSRRSPEDVKRGDSHPMKINPSLASRGMNCGRHKLTDDEVLDCRKSFNEGVATASSLAKKYRVSFQCIYYLLKRKTWRHI